jgi:uncharacterized protein (TIGR00251 family)
VSAYRFTVRVKPGASREAVGGRWRDDALIVAVRAKAVDGKANAAVRAALADAFGTRPSRVEIVTGARSRDKVIKLDPAPDDAHVIYARLLND